MVLIMPLVQSSTSQVSQVLAAPVSQDTEIQTVSKARTDEATTAKVKDLCASMTPAEAESITRTHQTTPADRLSTQLQTQTAKVEQVASRHTAFQAIDRRSTFDRTLDTPKEKVVGAFSSKIRGSIFLGHARRESDKRLESGIQKAKEEIESLKAALPQTADPAKKAEIKKKITQLEEKIKKMEERIEDRDSFAKKGREAREAMATIGGQRVSLTAADNTRLDGVFLDAQKLRENLKASGATLTTIQSFETKIQVEVPDESKKTSPDVENSKEKKTKLVDKFVPSKPVQAIRIPGDQGENGVMKALASMHAFSKGS